MSRSEFTAWGVELPPVGTECSVDTSGFETPEREINDLFHGRNATVVAHDEVFGYSVAVIRTKKNDHLYVYHALSAECFGPAKSKREQDIDALVEHLSNHYTNACHSEEQRRIQFKASRYSAQVAYDFIVSRIGGES